jgi:hypothetical protein
MDLAEAKAALADSNNVLQTQRVADFAELDTPNGPIRLCLTDRLRNRCRREKKWRSRGLLMALTAAGKGYDPDDHQRGVEGLFRVDRDRAITNRMMEKLFDGFLDKPDSLVPALEEAFGIDRVSWVPVRLVSEPFRLLGVFIPGEVSMVVLVDFDVRLS